MNANAQVSSLPFSTNNPTSSVADVTERAMLVSLTIKQPPTSKQDKEATLEVTSTHHADQDAARVNKTLYTKAMVEGFKKAASGARQALYDLTLPWGEGSRILLVANFNRLQEQMQSFERKFWEEMENFVSRVEENQDNERRRLGGLYRDDDYLSAEQLRNKFVFETKFMPLPDSGDWRVTLGKEDTEMLRRQTEEHLKNAYAVAAKEPWMRLKEVVGKMAEKLSDPNAKFHNTLVTNIEELCDLLPALNLANDPVLDQFAKDVRKKLTGVDPKDLRQDPEVRKTTAERAAELSGKVDEYMGSL